MFRRSAEKTDVILSASVAFDVGSLARRPGQMTFSDAKFFQALKKAIEEKGPAWESVTKRNGRVNGTKGMLYDNVSFQERPGRLQSFMTETRRDRHSAWRNSSTQDRFTTDHAPFHAPEK